MPTGRDDLVDRAYRWVRRKAIGAAVVIVFALVTGVGAFLGAWRLIFPRAEGLELTDMRVINDPDSVAAFRRVWLADSNAAEADPPWDPSYLFPSVRQSTPVTESAAVRGRETTSLPPLESIRVWHERVETERRKQPKRRGTGLLPIIDLKFRNTGPSAAFLTRVEILARRRTFLEPGQASCAVVPPSWEYNVLLNPESESQQVSLEVSQAVEANSVDRFVVVVGPGGYGFAEFDVELTVHYNQGQHLRLGKARVAVGGILCGELHPLDSLQRIPSSP